MILTLQDSSEKKHGHSIKNKAYRPNTHLYEFVIQTKNFDLQFRLRKQHKHEYKLFIVVCNMLKLCSRSFEENIFEWSYSTTSTNFNYTYIRMLILCENQIIYHGNHLGFQLREQIFMGLTLNIQYLKYLG